MHGLSRIILLPLLDHRCQLCQTFHQNQLCILIQDSLQALSGLKPRKDPINLNGQTLMMSVLMASLSGIGSAQAPGTLALRGSSVICSKPSSSKATFPLNDPVSFDLAV